MKKKFLSILLAASMMTGLLAGCGSGSSATQQGADEPQQLLRQKQKQLRQKMMVAQMQLKQSRMTQVLKLLLLNGQFGTRMLLLTG